MVEPRDRRGELRARHRASILAAARDLLVEGGAAGLTADALAARADVARRTLFNHFESLEEVVVTCLEAEIRAAMTTVESSAAHSAASGPLDQLHTSLSGGDVLDAIVRITRMTRGPGSAERQDRLRQQAMRHVAEPMARQLRARHPGLGELDAVLMTTTVLNGMSVIALTWLEETGGEAGTAGRRRWDELLDHLFTTLRRGFAAPTSPPTEGT